MLTDNGSTILRNDSELCNVSSGNILDGLYDFLKDAELLHYFEDLNTKLKVRSLAQLKYVDDTDLQTLGMTRPEMRRLKKYFAKECPQTTMGKLKKRLSRTTSCRSTSVPRPEDFANRINSFSIRINTNVPPTSPMDIDERTTNASVTNFSMTSNGTSDSSEWKLPGNKHWILQSNLTIGPLLHHHNIADLYKGTLRSDLVQIEVAVKVINKVTLRNEFNEFVRELFTICYLDHPNVIKLYGMHIDDFSIKMVTELAHCRTLSMTEVLLGPDSKSKCPITVLHGYVIQISDAMSYLEERSVIHGRLIGRNVLVFLDNQIKITDAGLFRAHSFHEKTDVTNPCNWLAPELFKGGRETLHSDVWAFGVLLWEMFSYYHHLPLSQMDESVSSQMDMRMPYLQQPDLCPNMIYHIIQMCWTETPRERPSFYQLSTQLIRLEPEQVVALTDGPDSIPLQRSDEINEPSDGSYSSLSEMQMLYYKAGDTIIVLDRSMNQYKELWRGCLLSGKSGYFKWANMRAIGVQYPPHNVCRPPPPQKTKVKQGSPGGSSSSNNCSIGETFSKIRISRREEKKKVSIDMISGPQNDFRHVGHVGANGEVFGDLTSLYAPAAQEKVKSSSVLVSSKPDCSKEVSGANKLISSSKLNSAGKNYPPYVTVDSKLVSVKPALKSSKLKEVSHKDAKKSIKTATIAQPPPPPPPERVHQEEESTTHTCLNDFNIGGNYSIGNDSLSLFDELSKQWEMHSSKIESPTSDTIVGTSITDTFALSSSPDRYSQSFNAGYSEVYDEPQPISISTTDHAPVEDLKLHNYNNDRHKSFIMNSSSPSTESNCAKSNIFQKIKGFGSGKQSKPKELCDGQKSPVYAKLKKVSKPKKQKEVQDTKKNIIGMPVLISIPSVNNNRAMEESFMDCSSEVSSLQPSPPQSVLSLTNGIITDPSPNYNRHNSIPGTNSHRKTSDSTTTSISPASSFASLTSTPGPAIIQGGSALRVLRKGDCVFRASSTVNAMNRKRPSLGQILADQNSFEAAMSRTRRTDLTLSIGNVKPTASNVERRNNFVSTPDNYEELDIVIDSSSTTPIASQLPDLPYIDLSFVNAKSREIVNLGDEDDAYNSLHSGSLGSDTIEPCNNSRQSKLSIDSNELLLNKSSNNYSVLRDTDSTTSTNQTFFNGKSRDTKYKFNNSNIFAMNGDNDEIAL